MSRNNIISMTLATITAALTVGTVPSAATGKVLSERQIRAIVRHGRVWRRTMGLSNNEQKRNSGLISAGLVMLLVLATPLAYAQFPTPPPPDAPFCGDGIRDPGPRGRARLTPCSFRLSFSFEENTSTHYL